MLSTNIFAIEIIILENIMIKLGKTMIIDFQDARLGPVQYDLVSLIHDSYVNVSKELEKEILDYYLSCAKDKNNQPINRDEFFSPLPLSDFAEML